MSAEVDAVINANVDVEQQILGSLLAFGGRAWQKLVSGGGVSEADFYRDDHRRIYRHIATKAADDGDFDALVIDASLQDSNERDLAGGLPYLLQLLGASVSDAMIVHHASIIKKHSKDRKIKALCADPSDPLLAEKLIALAAEGDNDEFARPALTLELAESVTLPPPDFVVSPLQRGNVGIISGADGSGKSFLALELAASVALGMSVGGIFDVPPTRQRALYIAGEDMDADHLRRMQTLSRMLKESGIRDIKSELDVRPLLGKRRPLLTKTRDGYAKTPAAARFAQQVKGYDIVILDPLRMFHDIEENDGVGMDILVRMLVDIAMKNQQVIVVIHHASQSAILDGRSDHHAGRGATDFPAGCRAAWTLRGMTQKEAEAGGIDEESRGDWKVLINGKASHGPGAGTTWLRRQAGGILVKSSYEPADLAEARRARVGVNKKSIKRELSYENDF